MKIRALLSFAFCVISMAVLPVDLAAQKKGPVIKLPPISVAVRAYEPTPAGRRLEAFDKAWSTINENYFDKTFSGLDWDKIREEYRPRVTAAKSDTEFHHILQEMISRLGKSHLSIIVPEYFTNLEIAKKQARTREKVLAAKRRGRSSDDGSDDDDEEMKSGDPALMRFGIGVELRFLGDKIVISHVEPQSGAALANIKPGFEIDKINGVALSEIVQKELLSGVTMREIRYLLPLGIVESFLNGPQDTSVLLSCLDETDKPKDFTVPRLRLEGETITLSKNLPEQFLIYESRSLSQDVGYIKFNVFAAAVIGKFCDSLTEFANKKSLIIDLRGNPGGIIYTMIGLSGMLNDKPITIGTMRSRVTSEPFVVFPKKKHFNGRIVVLVDSESLSASEIFTAGLQGNNRALVVGERTGGASLPSVWVKLPTGAVMLYPIADFITSNGKSLEGLGLEPDRTIAMDRQSLLRGEDMQLKEALLLAGDEKAFAKQMESRLQVQTGGLSTGGGPPPPPPPMKAPPKFIATAAATPTPVQNDARALKAISDFTAAVGGSEAVKNITSYEARGNMTAGKNDEGEAAVYAARQFPDKFVLVLSSPSVGEVREIYNGKDSFLQTDYGIDRPLYPNLDTTRFHLFSPVFDVLDRDYLRGLKYEGEFEVEGRKRQVLSAVTPKGTSVGMSFDSLTKMLVSYSSPGGLYTLGDYRKVDGMTLPFQVDLERAMKIKLDSVTINPKLDPGNFEKKEKCFDKAN